MRLKEYLKEEEYDVPHISGKSTFKTKIPLEKRTLKNRPRNSNGKVKVNFKDWMKMECFGSKKMNNGTRTPNYYGKAESDGKWYGYSHRAIYGFGIGDKVVKDCCGNIKKGKEWTIKTDNEAKKQAIAFARSVS